MLPLYALTIFLGAALLFLVQPLVARMLLPLLGGSPAVWNTCMVFFQAALLGGYLWAHASLRTLGPRRQAALHALLMFAPLAALPIALPAWEPPVEASPVPWLLAALAAAVGLPFLAVASAGPILQRWFSATDHPAARDPYFLYAASNAGSLVGLIAYPAVLEPLLTLRQQSLVFTTGYAALAVATVACAAALWRRPASPAMPAAPTPAQQEPAPTWRQRGLWVLLAFAPSSLMLGATQYLSTDIAAIPLLWVIPLGLYLITFILAFARRELIPLHSVSRLVPIIAVALAVAFLLEARRPAAVLIVMHLAMLFFGALLCHQRLAALRPAPGRLTEFYLLLSVGGVLGGVFNSLIAPVVFDTVLEYPIAIVLVCLLRPPQGAPATGRRLLTDLAGPAVLTVYMLIAADAVGPGAAPGPARILAYGLPVVASYLLSKRTLSFGAAVAVLLGISVFLPANTGRAVQTERTFFGVHRVAVERDGTTKVLYHGTTVHGLQLAGSPRPTTYYHPEGPIGQLFKECWDDPRMQRVGLVGMGVGSLAAYGRPGQHWTFYEIDPAVVRIARDSGHFTFLCDADARCDVVLGDGRRSLAREPDGEFGLIILDAFSSDAIPVHLLTREAVALYRSKLRPDGMLAFHLSNRHLELSPVLGAIMHDLGMHGFIADDTREDLALLQEGKAGSLWVVLVNDRAHAAPLARNPMWQPFAPPPGGPLWTDEYSNLLSVFGW